MGAPRIRPRRPQEILADLANDAVTLQRMNRGKHEADHLKQHAERETKKAERRTKAKTPLVTEIPNILLNDDEAVAISSYLKAQKLESQALKLEIRAGATIQTRIIAELPYQLSALDRLAIAREFCEQFENRKTIDKEGNKVSPSPIRYHCVIHAPDEHNDARNSHLHLVLYERPCDKIVTPEGPQWDFAVLHKKKYKSRNVREAYLDAQPFDRTLNDRDWPKQMRQRFSDIVNAKLAERAIERRYDPRSYEDMGLPIKPLSRISTNHETSAKPTSTPSPSTAP